MRIYLAPMEGVVNHSMRALLSELGGIDRCVTEFVRVSNSVISKRLFRRYCPELLNGGKTPSGVPVYIQLLGSHPGRMAASALVAAEMGAPGIDINFGCPSKLVNKNLGGSVLLKTPQCLHDIVHAVRQAVPQNIPVTAKIRLGYDDNSLFDEITDAIFAANPNELVIHARTKADGYRPPAYWHFIKDAQKKSAIPLIPNGEVWTPQDYQACVDQSGCVDVMIGRGILARPDLANQLKQLHQNQPIQPMHWYEIIPLMIRFLDLSSEHYRAECLASPLKQWLVYLKKGYPEMVEVFDTVKRLHDPDEIRAYLASLIKLPFLQAYEHGAFSTLR